MKKKIFSMLVALSMAMSMVVTPVSAEDLTEGYYTYTVTDGVATITDCDTTISGDVVIPSTLGGYPVTALGTRAFEYCRSIENITIPEGLTTVSQYAFKDCSALETISVSSTVSSIVTGTFFNCLALTDISVVDENPNFYSIDGTLFSKSHTLIQYPIGRPEATYEIPEGTFTILDFAFRSSKLEQIKIASTVGKIQGGAFHDCDNLTSIDIPYNITLLAAGAFEDCDALKSVKIGKNVEYLSSKLFYDCDSLAEVTFYPITTVGANAFYGCDQLRNVYFMGSEDEWNAISINTTGNSLLANAAITYDYTEPVTYTVTYDLNGGMYADKETDTVAEGEYADLGVMAECDGMQFMGWNTDPTAAEPLTEYIVKEDTTLYALWYVPTPEMYNVHYLPNGGDWVEMEMESLPEGAIPNFSVSATREGYTHIGWNTDPNATEGLTEYYITGETTLYAIWQYDEPVVYTVYYDANGGDWVEVESETLLADSIVNLDYKASREGYTFLGWNTDPEATEALEAITYLPEEGLMLYAIWEEIVEPSPEPTEEPTPEPTEEPTPEPSEEPTPEPTEEPTPEPSEEPTPEPSQEPLTPPTPSDSDFNNSSKAYTGSEYTISVGSTGADYVWYAFSPQETKEYSFFTTGSYYDTRGFLYNSNKECIAQDDNSGDYKNFKITHKLTAGEVYYIAIDVVSGGGQSGITGMPNSFGFKIDEEVEKEQMEVRVSDIKGLGGNMVEVDVMVLNNQGIANLGLEFDYDETVMTLTDVQYDTTVDARIDAAESFDIKPYHILFNNTQNFYFNGTLIKLIFTLNDGISVGKYPVTVDYYKGQDGTYEDGDGVNYDENFEPVSIKYTSGSVVVYTPGDIYNDNKINNKDATNLLRYLADWDLEDIPNLVTYALDTDGSGYVDENDATHLLRHLAKWGYELH